MIKVVIAAFSREVAPNLVRKRKPFRSTRKGFRSGACLARSNARSTPPARPAAVGPAHSHRTSEAGECHHVLLHTTRLPRPQLLSEAQMPRSRRNRSIGAELDSARMR